MVVRTDLEAPLHWGKWHSAHFLSVCSRYSNRYRFADPAFYTGKITYSPLVEDPLYYWEVPVESLRHDIQNDDLSVLIVICTQV